MESQGLSGCNLTPSHLVALCLPSINTKFPASPQKVPKSHPVSASTLKHAGALSSLDHGQQPPGPAI